MKLPFPSLICSASIFLLAFSSHAYAAEFPALETPPKGLADSDWSSIRAAYEAGRHAPHRQEDGTLTARNPGQQWRTEFDGKGFTVSPDHGHWTWGLELTAYGERSLPSASSTITHAGGKITCQRDASLTEWFINDTRGLEQGWTIQSRSVDVSPAVTNLTLTLALRGNLKARISPDPSSVSFQTESGGTALSYGGLKAWDADGKNLAVRFEDAGANAIRIAVDDQNARYPITIDPIAQQAYLKAGNTGSDDYFGFSVAVSGDTVVVGAIGEDSSTTGVNSTPNENAPFSGAAYVFVRSGGTWSQQAYLKASNTGSHDSFGIAVAVSGDTVVVGAKGEDSSLSGVNRTPNESAGNSGAAYVFMRSGGTWSQQAYLKASNPGWSDEFGRSVAVSGDTVVIGALWENSNTTGVNSTPNNSAEACGAAYVFVRNSSTWNQQAYLKASNTGVLDYFGSSVAVSGDTVVVGAFGENSSTSGVNSTPNENAAYSGAAYVFARSGVTWSQQAYLKGSNPERDDYFGNAVAVSGDTAVIGAPFENNGASDSGGVYVFVRSGVSWSQQAHLKASNTGREDAFGISVALSEHTVVVGANLEDSNTSGVNSMPNESASGSGAAYVFGRSGGTWSQQAYLKASNTGSLDGFGTFVAVSGNTVVVGAPNEDSSSTGVNSTPNESAGDSGAAYVFDLGPPPTFSPEIAMEQAGSDMANGATKAFGHAVVGTTADLIFTVFNTGTADLTLTGTPKVAVAGSSDFTVTIQPASLISGPSGSSNFTVRFTPSGSGLKTGSLSISNNDDNENSFVIQLTGTVTAQADLALTLSDSPDPVNAGGNLACTIVLTNNGPSTAVAPIISLPLPASTTFVSANAPAGWTATTPAVGGTGTVNFTNASFVSGGTATFTVVAKVDLTVVNNSTLTATATAASATTDPTPGNNSATATTLAKSGADLQITLADSPDPVVAGTNLTYTLQVANNGPLDADNVSITDTLPAGTTFVSLITPAGWTPTAPAVGGTGSVTITRPLFALGGSATFTLVVKVAPGVANGTVLSDTASVTSTTLDIVPGNNSATATSTVTTQSDLAIQITGTPTTAPKGSNVTYAITLTNNGPSDASAPNVSLPLPVRMTFVSATAPGGWSATTPAVGSNGTVVFSRSFLATGATVSFTVVAKVKTTAPTGSILTATAAASSTALDPAPANNIASTTSAVGTVNATAVQPVTTGIAVTAQTGLFDVIVNVTNTTPLPINGFRLHVNFNAYKAAFPSLRLYNASSAAGAPDVYVDFPYPVAVDAVVAMKLSFYTRTRTFPSPFKPVLTVETLQSSQVPDTNGNGVQPRLVQLADKTVLLEFPSVVGRWYRVRYSADMVHWFDCPVPLQAGNSRMQWIDSGPPFTNVPPASAPARFYLVNEIAAP